MLNDSLASALSKILNSERIGKSSCTVSPSSKVIKKVLDIMNREGYIGKYDEVTKAKGGVLNVNLIGKVNNCGVIKPRFTVNKDGFEKFEQRFLLADNFGMLIISTNQGMITQNEAKKKEIGGRLIAFCY